MWLSGARRCTDALRLGLAEELTAAIFVSRACSLSAMKGRTSHRGERPKVGPDPGYQEEVRHLIVDRV